MERLFVKMGNLWYSYSMNKSENSKLGGLTKFKAKLLTAYYGNPLKDMKMICVAGATGKRAVAEMIYKVLETAGQKVAVLASDEEIKMGALYKFLGDAWKSGANFVIVTVNADSLAKGVFYGLPIHVAALTNYLASAGFLEDETETDKRPAEMMLFEASPEIVVLNHDDEGYPMFRNFAGTKATLTYGRSHFSDVLIESSKLYKKGSEVHLNIAGMHFTVASFLTGEESVSYMAAVAAVATALKIASDPIVEGVADYEPEE